MFHLIIGLMAMGMMAVAVAIMTIPLWLGPLLQALLTALSGHKVMMAVPGILGGAGLILSLYYYHAVFPLWGIFLYWILYALFLYIAHTLVCKVKKAMSGKK